MIRRPAVVCRFSDGHVEVVPAYAGASGYWIADPTDGWMKTYPKDHNQYVNDVNTKHNGAVKKLARQVKVWKYRRNVPVSLVLPRNAQRQAHGRRDELLRIVGLIFEPEENA